MTMKYRSSFSFVRTTPLPFTVPSFTPFTPYSTSPNRPVLTRDFIYSALYRNDHGYFTNPVLPVITQPSEPINFNHLWGPSEYRYRLQQIYKTSRNGWLTPVEIFAPWYSYAVAAYIIQHHLNRLKTVTLTSAASSSSPSPSPLIIYEIGGGNGTHAKYVLDYIQKKVPHIYQSMTYRILEVSSHLQQIQTTTLRSHTRVARSERVDGMMIHQSLPMDPRYCYITAFEVLDNLPHDKIVAMKNTDTVNAFEQPSTWCEQTPIETSSTTSIPKISPAEKKSFVMDKYGNYVYETYVESLSSSSASTLPYNEDNTKRLKFRERYQPLKDTYIKEVYDLWRTYQQTKETLSSPMMNPLMEALDKDDQPLSTVQQSVNWFKQTFVSRSSSLPDGYRYGRYLPTGSYQFLHSIYQTFPNHSLLLADFTYLPPPKVLRSTIDNDSEVLVYAPGVNSPIVASKSKANAGTDPTTTEHETMDHLTYMSAYPGTADIFFPTNFYFLMYMIQHVHKQYHHRNLPSSSSSLPYRIQSSREFLGQYADIQRTRTMTGYNPLLDDFTNTAFLCT